MIYTIFTLDVSEFIIIILIKILLLSTIEYCTIRVIETRTWRFYLPAIQAGLACGRSEFDIFKHLHFNPLIYMYFNAAMKITTI